MFGLIVDAGLHTHLAHENYLAASASLHVILLQTHLKEAVALQEAHDKHGSGLALHL